jgi:hypothetical protein
LAPQNGGAPHLELLCYQNPNVIAEVAAMDDPRSTRLILEGGDACMRDPDGHVLEFVAARANS